MTVEMLFKTRRWNFSISSIPYRIEIYITRCDMMFSLAQFVVSVHITSPHWVKNALSFQRHSRYMISLTNWMWFYPGINFYPKHSEPALMDEIYMYNACWIPKYWNFLLNVCKIRIYVKYCTVFILFLSEFLKLHKHYIL